MAPEHRFVASGTSMLPAIFPRDELVARAAERADLVVGAIVAFPGNDVVVSHRIVAIELGRREERVLVVRGDFQDVVERIPERAVAYVVVEVRGRFGTYRASDSRGRALARLALARRGPLAVARRVASLALGLALWARRRSRPARSV